VPPEATATHFSYSIGVVTLLSIVSLEFVPIISSVLNMTAANMRKPPNSSMYDIVSLRKMYPMSNVDNDSSDNNNDARLGFTAL
jgi:hypothetical protein